MARPVPGQRGGNAGISVGNPQAHERRGTGALGDYLAYYPTAGDLIPGTGGVRKLRWGLEGRGKRGGARVIYFHHDAGMPLFALTAFAKNERADLSQQDRNDFRQLTMLLVEAFKRRRP
jgi:hypothetical protein